MSHRFERYHPLVSFLYYTGALSLFILMLHPIFLVAALFMVLLINFRHDRYRRMKRWWIFLFSTFLLMLFLNPLFNERGRHLLFEIHHHRVTLEAISFGGMNALSIICVIAIFISYNIVMTPNKLLYLFSKFLPQFAILLMLTLRFIPLMRRRLEEISTIQRSKGVLLTTGTWKYRVKTGMLYIQTLLTFSLEEAIQTADSMEARGYGTRSRSSYEYFTFRKKDFFVLLFLIILYAVIILGRIRGYGYLTVYPIMESWGLSPLDFQTLIFYLLFLSFPIWIEAGGKFQWRLSN